MQFLVTEPFFQRNFRVATWQTYRACQVLGLALHGMVSFDSTYEKVLSLDPFYRWEVRLREKSLCPIT